jgi:hypothetical protein
MVRLDPGTADGYLPGEVRDERLPAQPKKRQGRARPLETTGSGFRALLAEARESIASAVERLPSTDPLTMIVNGQPTRCSRKINSFRKADELDLTFDWSAMPFDARIVRAIMVLHYEGTSSANDFAQGRRDAPQGTGGAGFLVPLLGKNMRFVGLVDEMEDSHGEEGDGLTLKARDLTALLIDTKWPPALEVKIPAGATIIDAVKLVLEKNPVFELLRGPFLRASGPAPALNPKLYPRLAITARERHRAERSGGPACALRYPPKAGGDSSFWDVITDLCVSHGLRPTVERDAIVLLEPRVLYTRQPGAIDQLGTPTFPTPYRAAIEDTEHSVRRMVYGDNVETLRFHRKFAREKRPTIEVTSRNPDAKNPKKRLLTVRWPPKGALSGRATTIDKQLEQYRKTVEKQFGGNPLVGATLIAEASQQAAALKQSSPAQGANANTVNPTGQAEDKIRVVQLHGIVDEKQLAEVAKQIYEAIGRGEFGVVIETKELASFSDHPAFDPNRDPDLLDLRAADPIQVLVASTMDRARIVTLSEFQQMIDRARANATTAGPSPRFVAAVQYLERLGFKTSAAEALVRALTSANLPDVFYVVAATVNFDSENGFSVSIEARDYARVRGDPEGPTATKRAGPAAPTSRAALKR